MSSTVYAFDRDRNVCSSRIWKQCCHFLALSMGSRSIDLSPLLRVWLPFSSVITSLLGIDPGKCILKDVVLKFSKMPLLRMGLRLGLWTRTLRQISSPWPLIGVCGYNALTVPRRTATIPKRLRRPAR